MRLRSGVPASRVIATVIDEDLAENVYISEAFPRRRGCNPVWRKLIHAYLVYAALKESCEAKQLQNDENFLCLTLFLRSRAAWFKLNN